ncbi:hypothetical protein HK104_007226, partial [Borealophlyctis nickersoniae]
CTSLALQRLEHACEVKPFLIPPEIHDPFNDLLAALTSIIATTDDPFIIQTAEASAEAIRWLMSPKPESDTLMSSPVALSFLSQVLRMAPPRDMQGLVEPFCSVLEDLKEKREWHLGRKFIQLLATSATLNPDACRMFLTLLHHLLARNLGWQWPYLGILCLGVVVLTSEGSAVRKIAMEGGLVSLVGYTGGGGGGSGGEREGMSEDDAWKIRAAAATVLSEVYQHLKSEPIGLLAHEAMAGRREVETHPFVSGVISKGLGLFSMPPQQQQQDGENSSLAAPGTAAADSSQRNPAASLWSRHRKLRRVSYLPKYICMAMAETYAESQSRYMFLRKYLRTTDRQGNVAQKRGDGKKVGMGDLAAEIEGSIGGDDTRRAEEGEGRRGVNFAMEMLPHLEGGDETHAARAAPPYTLDAP